ncbi:MAG: HAMP domain-containing sensor histidine kinase [Chloroflexota bacterium]
MMNHGKLGRPPNVYPDEIANPILRHYELEHNIAFARVDQALKVQDASTNFGDYSLTPSSQIIGESLSDLFFELVGEEEALYKVVHGETDHYHLPMVNRCERNGQPQYLAFWLKSWLKESVPQFFFLIEDTTKLGQLQQSLTQERNELRLAQQELSEAHQALEQLSKFKSFLLSMSAHDFRHATSVIMGYLQFLELEMDKRGHFNDAILDALKRQTHTFKLLLENLLDFDQIEQNKLKITPKPIDINAAIVQTVAGFQLIADQSNITIVVDLPVETLQAKVTPHHFQQILNNLLGNALKYTPEGGMIQIVGRPDQEFVRIDVIDTGIGLTEAQKQRVFETYYSSRRDEQLHTASRGLGLHIVKRFVEANHGQIVVTSTLGQGTQFQLYFPLA